MMNNSPPSADEVMEHGTTTNMVEMTPMDSQHMSSSLPLPDEYAVDHRGSVVDNKSPNGNRRKYLLVGGTLLALVVIIGASVGATSGRRGRNSSTGSSTSNSNTANVVGTKETFTGGATEGNTNPITPGGSGNREAPPASTPDPDLPPLEMTDVVDWFATRGVSSRGSLLASNTPQNMAAQYMTSAKSVLPTDEDNNSTAAYLFTSQYVMTTVFYSLNGNNWTTPVNFLEFPESVCEWNDLSFGISGSDAGLELGGLICDQETGLPMILDLELNNMEGSLPTELGLITSLQLIDMEYNTITGTVPTELCKLTELKHLWLRKNKVTGSIPDCLGSSLTNIVSLNMQDNVELTGTIPSSLCQMTQLESIVFDRCGLSGPLPSCVDAWTEMVILSFADNTLTGDIPTELSVLTQLREIYIDGNVMEGNPLSTLNALTEIDLVYVEENAFSGAIGPTSLNNLVKARAIDLSENEFTMAGNTFPTELMALPDLHILDLSKNKLAGSIPDTIAAQDTLVFFSVHENELTGTVPESLTNLGNLQHVDLANNQLGGALPEVLFQQENILHIFLSENPGFTEGPIPDIVNATQLREISLKNTNRNGPLPEMVGFTNLFLFDVDDNDITGTIPSNYGVLPALRHLILNSNPQLGGDLPLFTDEAGNLGTVLLDKTGVIGDFNTICELPTFTGEQEIPTDVIMIADCADPDSEITCDCCYCCNKDQPVCSDPRVASLDWTWEHGFQRAARDFAINATRLQRPTLAVTSE